MPRRVAAILVVLVAALLLPTSVTAAKAQRSSDSALNLFCPSLRSDAGTVSLGGWIGDRGGTYLEFGFWPGQVDPWETQPTLVGYSTSTLLNGTSVDIDFDVYATDASGGDEESGSFLLGQATLSATFEPTGEDETFRDHVRDGNQQYRSSGSWERLAVSGSLRLPEDRSFDVSGCDASNFTQSTFVNAPAVSTQHSTSLMVICNWSTDAGYITFSAEESPSLGTGFWLWIEGGDGFFYADGPGSITPNALEASLDVFAPSEEDDSPVGSATASAVLTRGDRLSASNTFGDSRYSAKGFWIIPDGSLALAMPTGSTTLSIDEEHCTASNYHWSKVPGRTEHADPVANETPDAAIPLKVGDKVLVTTAGAETAPEASCVMDDGEGGSFEAPMTNTVWWRIEGTGSSITVDTAGSTFDTLVAVYLAEGDKVGEQVGCVDDVDEGLTARITFDTVADASYLVQTGGFDGSTGDLTVLVYE